MLPCRGQPQEVKLVQLQVKKPVVTTMKLDTDPQCAREVLELGAVAYVDKPFDYAHLKRVVAMALQHSA